MHSMHLVCGNASGVVAIRHNVCCLKADIQFVMAKPIAYNFDRADNSHRLFSSVFGADAPPEHPHS